jgi:hypothetical protein
MTAARPAMPRSRGFHARRLTRPWRLKAQGIDPGSSRRRSTTSKRSCCAGQRSLGHFWSGRGDEDAAFDRGRPRGNARIPSSETANEYIYAKDVGRAVDAAATAARPPQIHFNIGNGYVSSFDDVLDAVRALCPEVRYEVEAGEPPHSKIAPLDISAAKRHLGWEPRFTIKSAFEDYLKDLKMARAAAKT